MSQPQQPSCAPQESRKLKPATSFVELTSTPRERRLKQYRAPPKGNQ